MLLSQKGTSELNLFVISCDSLNLAMETEQEHTDSKLGGGQCNARRVMCILKYRILMRLQEDVVAFFLGSSVIPEFPTTLKHFITSAWIAVPPPVCVCAPASSAPRQ